MMIKLHIIESITKDFSDEHKVGSGGYGDVYKGVYNGKEIAVKMLNQMAGLDDDKFHNELDILMSVQHPNIVQFVGYCHEVRLERVMHKGALQDLQHKYRILCFEYLPDGSLDKYLSEASRGHDWCTRYKIIKGISEGLNYLHGHGQEVRKFHLDLKPANILLDKNMIPKIADFGLSRLFSETKTHITKAILGTDLYMPPEYRNKGHITDKYDVYSFGVIIIQIMTGPTGYETFFEMPHERFIKRVHHNWKKRINQTTMHASLEVYYHQVKRCIEIAVDCVETDKNKRPTIAHIINMLSKTEIRIHELSSHMDLACFNPKELLGVDPLELCFPFEPNKDISCTLHLTNKTDGYIAFNIQTSSPHKYCTQPNRDVVPPRSKCCISITMQAQGEAPPDMQCKDEFVVQSASVNMEGLKPEDITGDMFNRETGNVVNEVKLTVSFDAPPQLPCPLPEEPKEDLSLATLAVSDTGNVNYRHASNVPQSTANTGQGERVSKVSPGSSSLLDVHPLQLYFPFEPNKIIPCALHLRNNTDESVVFSVAVKGGPVWWPVRLLPGGVVPLRSSYTLVVTMKEMATPPRCGVELIMLITVLGDQHIDLDKIDKFFTEAKEKGKVVHEVSLKVVFGSQGDTITEMQHAIPPGIKILSVEYHHEDLESLDVNPIEPWIITGHLNGDVRIWNHDTQTPVDSLKVTLSYFTVEKVHCAKFIGRKQWFVVGSDKGFIHVYNYATKIKIASFKTSTNGVRSLAIHPTQPYVLSLDICTPIKLWDWDKGWECSQTFDEHSGRVRQVVFNPKDSNSFASASDDHTLKVWSLASPYSSYTLSGHSDKVNCLDYFTCGDQQYLISGSDDQTAKIWDLQKKMCVQTLEAFWSPVTSVGSHPNLPLLITGTKEGAVLLWSSSNFRLERILKSACIGEVRGLGCLMERRVVIAQRRGVSMFSIDNLNYQQESMACNEPQ